jgi:hypothetical protein
MFSVPIVVASASVESAASADPPLHPETNAETAMKAAENILDDVLYESFIDY